MSGAGYAQQSSSDREAALLKRIDELERRLAILEARLGPADPKPTQQAAPAPPPPPPAAQPASEVTGGATINGTLDGYYGWNFNRPIDRINLLRAYDRRANNFTLNQLTFVIEKAPDVAAGRRWGIRADMQYGIATQTLQGSFANEPRPWIYRPLYQVYGTYIFPLGKGLTVDFGKWYSALGIEGNYTKDQLNYSRSYWFDFLPFYHFGFRASYDVAKKVNLTYWLVNGVQQSEDFNNSKSQGILWNVKPTEHITFNVNFYSGIEDRFPPRRRTNIFDSYLTWSRGRLTLAGEGDFVHIGAGKVWGGAGYAAYQWAKRWRTAARAEYLSDPDGLFSGVSQALKEGTLTQDYRIADGFLLRWEWRTDFSNQPFFLTAEPRFLKRQQSTATMGMIWWFGPKQGPW